MDAMKRMTAEELEKVLDAHKLYLNRQKGGSAADLSGADLHGADLSGANLSGANLSGADLSGADLSGADLSKANLRWANLSVADLHWADLHWADLRVADLREANLSGANLRVADLREANLSGANLRVADLREANLSGAGGLLPTVNYLAAHFERTEEGYIAYKTFGAMYSPPGTWKLESGAILEENVNFDRCSVCGCGINVAPLKWVKSKYKGDIWKVLIRWEWLCGVCVPYQTDGKIRCERVELVEVVKRG